MNPIRDEYSKIEASTQSKDKILKNILYSQNESNPKLKMNPIKVGSIVLGLLVVFVLITPMIKNQFNSNPVFEGKPLISTIKSKENKLSQIDFNTNQGGLGLGTILSEDIEKDYSPYNSGEGVTHLHVLKNKGYNPNSPAAPPNQNFTKEDILKDAMYFIDLFKLDIRELTFEDLKYEAVLYLKDYGISIRKSFRDNVLAIQIEKADEFIEDYGLAKFPVRKTIGKDTKEQVIDQLKWGREALKLPGKYNDHIECDLSINQETYQSCHGYSYLSSEDAAQEIFNELSTKFTTTGYIDEGSNEFRLYINLSIPYEFESEGYYPIITPQQAYQKLLNNEYTSWMTHDMKETDEIYSQGLTYFIDEANEKLIPVYKFFVDVSDDQNVTYPKGKSYGFYYVSAIDGEYVKTTFNSLVSHPNLIELDSEILFTVEEIDFYLLAFTAPTLKRDIVANNNEGLYLVTNDVKYSEDGVLRKLSYYNFETKEISDIKEFIGNKELYTMIENHGRLFAIIFDHETNELFFVKDFSAINEKWVKLESIYPKEDYEFILLNYQLYLRESNTIYKVFNENLEKQREFESIKDITHNNETIVVYHTDENNKPLLSLIDYYDNPDIVLEHEIHDVIALDRRIIVFENDNEQLRFTQVYGVKKYYNVTLDEALVEIEYLNNESALVTEGLNLKGILLFKKDNSIHYQKINLDYYTFERRLSDYEILVSNINEEYFIIKLDQIQK